MSFFDKIYDIAHTDLFKNTSFIVEGTKNLHFCIALTNSQIITLSSANLPLAFGSDQRLDYCG